MSVYEINPNPNEQTRINELATFSNIKNCVTTSVSWVEQSKLFMSDSTGNIKMWDLTTNAQMAMNVQHNAPVKDVV